MPRVVVQCGARPQAKRGTMAEFVCGACGVALKSEMGEPITRHAKDLQVIVVTEGDGASHAGRCGWAEARVVVEGGTGEAA